MSDLLDLLREILRLESQRDSLEIGTPGKAGAVKVYVDFSDVEATKDRIRKAFEARAYANELLERGLTDAFGATLRETKREGAP